MNKNKTRRHVNLLHSCRKLQTISICRSVPQSVGLMLTADAAEKKKEKKLKLHTHTIRVDLFGLTH